MLKKIEQFVNVCQMYVIIKTGVLVHCRLITLNINNDALQSIESLFLSEVNSTKQSTRLTGQIFLS